ncbi:MAG: tRNA (adenosine(37)-N6)-dimethylallyltransferase MiaA [Candidatus Kapabacteria bacterium]|nr:tRNA (adenosine(37)-N6)-dimethylallyltransferase MiaA [Candidatus Kapabacteria bacterium]
MKPIVVICGPTCSGKTELSIKIAQELKTEIISADSRQMYKMLDIGTAKPSKFELNQIKHHFIDNLNPDENYSAGKFENEADIIINQIFESNKIPVIVGGSGLYIKAVIEGFSSKNESEELYKNREILNERFKNEGIDSILDELRFVDPESVYKYKDENPRRIIRALEYCLTYKTKFSLSHFEKTPKYKAIYFHNNISREDLYNKINLRSDLMWQNGIIEETLNVINKGYSKEINSLNTIGYKEVIEYLDGKLNESEALNKIRQFTRNYAKRQITWCKKLENVNYVDFQNENKIKKILLEINKFFEY